MPKVIDDGRSVLRVRKSRIDGKGAFAKTGIGRNRLIGEMWGEVITTRESWRRAAQQQRVSIVDIDGKQAVDLSETKSPMRYVNHSCHPNTRVRVTSKWIRLYALRNITPGEELSLDYGETHHKGKLPCRCGAPGCRGAI